MATDVKKIKIVYIVNVQRKVFLPHRLLAKSIFGPFPAIWEIT